MPLDRSFDEFYAAEYDAMVRLAFGLTGRFATAEELAQEAFLAAFRKWNRLATYDEPTSWVRRVVTNRCVSSWRRGVTELRLLARLRRERVGPVLLPEADERVLRAVRSLPARQRVVIALVLLDDRSVNEAATILGCAPETVRTHLRRGRLALAESLGGREEAQ